MRITIVRRITQAFFFALFLWFCICATPGQIFFRLRGWPVNWFLQLDPLVALGSILTTRTLYAGLLWAVATVALTALLGRFFCGWVCPFGALHHLVGWIGWRARSVRERTAVNRYRDTQRIKYYVLLVLLAPALGGLALHLADSSRVDPLGIAAALAILAIAVAASKRADAKLRRPLSLLAGLAVVWASAGWFLKLDGVASSALMTGFLDPIPLVYRSVNLLFLPLADSSVHLVFAAQRHYETAFLTATLFLGALFLNLAIPRFYCRFVCPLGALYGLLGRYALWRVGKKPGKCSQCGLCGSRCEGGCDPAGAIRISECVLCLNCLDTCNDHLMGYNTFRSASGETLSPDLSRRGFVTSALCAVVAVPMLRLDGKLGRNYDPALIRPPGSLAEPDFLDRCIRCGQCARVCPTNVIQPDTLREGLESLWTPALNMRAGTSGCQKNCTACGEICPTAAIRPLSLDEKLGLGSFSQSGPIRIGTAFVDRGRCLPWAMNRPCIVCQENCPVSPKAIYVKESFAEVRNGRLEAASVSGTTVTFSGPALRAHRFETGDFFAAVQSGSLSERRRIVSNSGNSLTLEAGVSPRLVTAAGGKFTLQIRLQAPVVDPDRCIGCGVCEHECPVSGRRAIRVSAEGESRSRKHSLLLK
ncbi:MAG: 4Fe-4S binding protein [Syntrophobacteraceae bacterium]|nr:4Fe-4S binding protein [Syntrophobacteraceae bacterium]